MEVFAKAKESFLRRFLKLENGLPSRDTFSRLFRLLETSQFQLAFQRLMAGFADQSTAHIIWAISQSGSVLIFVHDDIEPPLQPVLDTPMRANNLVEALGS